ncbi:EutN/CcmL family microcompartment protein [candidate division KSB1 bacterium]|nr:EutN/CcmL family microcompartment protein [candidate division KSB1 bacterium]
MILARVVGSLVSTDKHLCYQSKTILLVRPINPDGSFAGSVQVAVDSVGAGKDDCVLVASEGRAATEILQFDRRMPLRSIILAIVDRIDHPLAATPNTDNR